MSFIPLVFGNDDRFARVRQCFQNAGFDHEAAAMRASKSRPQFPPYGEPNVVPDDADAQEILFGIFLRFASADVRQAVRSLGQAAMDDLEALGMVRRTDGRVKATVRVRPMLSIWAASDLWDDTQGPEQMPDDIVYPPDTPNTLNFLAYIPLTRCERYLEVCGGSGVAALIGARKFAHYAWSFDITERSTAFAAFNGKLNGLSNFAAACGDAYEPAGDETYDRIVAHPPYVPVLQHTWIYHAGGNDGEQVTRKLISGLPKHLAPGGRFYCRCVCTDRAEGLLESRIRQWLGEQHTDFDVATAVVRSVTPDLWLSSRLFARPETSKDVRQWIKLLDELKITRFLFVELVVQRRAEPRDVFTVRREQGPESGPREMEWLLHWETLRMKGCEDLMLGSRLRAGAFRLHAKHAIHEGKWVDEEQRLDVRHPYICNWEVFPLAAHVLPLFDGKMTGLEVYQKLLDEQVIGTELDPRRFAVALAELVSGGFVVVEGHEPPAPQPVDRGPDGVH